MDNETREQRIKECTQFAKDNFLRRPSVQGLSVYSLFQSEYGTFTDPDIIKAALDSIKPDEYYKHPKNN